MFIFHPMVSVTVFIVSRGSHWPDAYFSMCDIKSLSIYLSISTNFELADRDFVSYSGLKTILQHYGIAFANLAYIRYT